MLELLADELGFLLTLGVLEILDLGQKGMKVHLLLLFVFRSTTQQKREKRMILALVFLLGSGFKGVKAKGRNLQGAAESDDVHSVGLEGGREKKVDEVSRSRFVEKKKVLRKQTFWRMRCLS